MGWQNSNEKSFFQFTFKLYELSQQKDLYLHNLLNCLQRTAPAPCSRPSWGVMVIAGLGEVGEENPDFRFVIFLTRSKFKEN